MPLKVPSETRDSDTSTGGRKADPILCDALNVQGVNILYHTALTECDNKKRMPPGGVNRARSSLTVQDPVP